MTREQGASGLVHRRARMLVRDVAHEARDGGEASARALAAPVVTIAERRKSGHGRWRSRVGQDRSSHARLNGGDACTRKGVGMHEVNSRRGPRNRRGSWRWWFSTIRGSTQLSKRRRQNWGCYDLQGGPRRLLLIGKPFTMNVCACRCRCEHECVKL